MDGRIASSIFLSIHMDVLKIEGVLFAAGVSNKSGVETCPLTDATGKIDFDMLYGGWKDWRNPEIQSRLQQVERYEILIPDHIPLDLILNLPNG